MNSQYEVLSPWAEVDSRPLHGISPRIADINGNKIGLFCNSKLAAAPIMAALEKEFKARFPDSVVSRYDALEQYRILQMEGKNRAEFEKWLKDVDTVIAAVGDWGSCTKYLVYEAISIEEMNKPVAALCNEGFANDARSAASSRGWPGIRIVPETIPCECSVMEQAEAGISAAMDAIIAAVTRPLTAEETSPRPKEAEEPSRITFKGDLEEVNRFFYKRGWTDGFPVIPPTEEKVAEMVNGTDLPVDHIVGNIIPRLGKATIEKIAVNAVMAGALPTYMPVLIAAVQALLDPQSTFGGWQVSTGSWSPFWILNGPIRNDLHVNSGSGVMSPGDIANATIGRAMGLIIKNIGGARKGIEDMGVMGNPMKYTAVIAENEEASPWEPLHVEHGFNQEDSTITVFSPNSYYQVIAYTTDDKGILSTIVYNLGPGRRDGDTCIVMNPAHASILAGRGWSKKDIVKYVSEHAYVPFSHHPYYWGSHVRESTRKFMPVNPHDNMLLIPDPGKLRVVVAGGPGNFLALIRGSSDIFITKKVELPADWEKLVAKYKDVIPTYIRY